MADEVRLPPDPSNESSGGRGEDVSGGRADSGQGLEPWQLFLLAALACATVGMFVTRAQGIAGVVLLTVLIGAAALVGLGTLLAVRPLASKGDDQTRVVGQRTRNALDREKTLALRAIKELEFDRAMGKLSESDFQEMSLRLRARATRLIRQLEAGEGYRGRIERDLAERLKDMPEPGPARQSEGAAVRECPACRTANDADARFCKECGVKL